MAQARDVTTLQPQDPSNGGWALQITGQDANDTGTHDDFKSVCVVPGGGATPSGDTWREDQIYTVVERVIDGNMVTTIELFTPVDWGEPNYCWFVDCAGGNRITQYQPGQAAIPEIPAIPAVPPVQFRPEAVIYATGQSAVFLDPNYTFIQEAIAGAQCWTVAYDDEGYTYLGLDSGDAIHSRLLRFDLDLNPTAADFYQPNGGWDANPSAVLTLRPTKDSLYVYAGLNSNAAGQSKVYKFRNSDGTEMWNILGNVQGMYVDGNDNLYLAKGKYDSNGNLVTAYNLATFLGAFQRDLWVDEVNSRVWASGGGGIAVCDIDGGNYTTLATPALYVWCVKAFNGDLFFCTTRGSIGGNGPATLWRYDATTLTFETNFDSGAFTKASYIWFDKDNNLIFKIVGKIYVMDTNLNVLANYVVSDDGTTAGCEGMAIPYMTAGTPEVPGIPGVPEIPEAWFTHDANQLSGASVCVYADGAPRGSFTMDGNDILGFTEANYGVVIAGLNYWSKLETMPIVVAPEPNAIIADKQIMAIRFDFDNTYSLRYGMGGDSTPQSWTFNGINSSVFKLERGTFPYGSRKKATVYIDVWDPVPLGIRALVPEIVFYRP